MEKFVVFGGKKLKGQVNISGAKNVAMKTLVAALLTDEEVIIRNVPLISSVTGTAQIVEPLGVKIKFTKGGKVAIDASAINKYTIPLELGGLYRTVPMTIGPLLYRFGKAVVPNPGGCRLGKRPINMHIDGLEALGAKIDYKDGYYYASCTSLVGTTFRFAKNTHTGTEALLLASVFAKGKTVLENAAQEPEVDNLIALLNQMGAKIKRVEPRTIKIEGVSDFQGADFTIMPDRNETVTFAIAAYITQGDIFVRDINQEGIEIFLEKLDEAGARYQIDKKGIRFFSQGNCQAVNIETGPYPKFMTDWQAPWAVFATQAVGESIIHETVFESRFGYVSELRKMGAKIKAIDLKVKNPHLFYNFNYHDKKKNSCAIKITGAIKLHNAIVEVSDLRAGATLVLAALCAYGKSVIYGIEHIDRGYQYFEKRLQNLGANIKRVKE